MSYTVRADALPIRLGETDTVRSVLQNVALLLRTRAGSSPMYRSFGLPMEYLDKPIPAARQLLHAEIRDAVERFEPRCDVVSVTFSGSADDPCGLIPTVEVEIHAQ